MSEPEISIAGRKIGPAYPPYIICIICELSANHNGSLERAIKKIEFAVETGAEAIKIQLSRPTPSRLTRTSQNSRSGAGG